MSSAFAEADALFKRLNVELAENIDDGYFFDPRDFRSLIEVLKVLGEKADQIESRSVAGEGNLLESLKHQNAAYSKLLNQQKLIEKVIEDVVTFQHGGLNNSVDTMTEVIREYTRGQTEVQSLRQTLVETKTVLTAKKNGQLAMKDLWLKKKELEESLRILADLEWLKDSPLRVQRLIQQKRYLNAVDRLNKASERMFSEDLVDVTGISGIREQLLELKGRILEEIVSELRDDVVGMHSSALLSKENGDVESDSESLEGSELRSEQPSILNDSKSVVSVGSKNMDTNISSAAEPVNNSSSVVPFSSEEPAFDLLTVDGAAEMNISDMSSAGIVYIRLLVRAVGLLRCEADVERLLLESASAEFVNVLQRYRAWAYSRYRKHLYKHSNKDPSELDGIVSELFAEYIVALLEAAVSMLKKLLYVLRLLSFSKYVSSSGITSIATALALNTWKYEVKDSTRKAILSLWTDVEGIIIAELKVHFVEKEVEKISDLKTQTSSMSPTKSNLLPTSQGDDEDTAQVDVFGPIFPPSVRHAAAVYRHILAFVDVMQDIFKQEGFTKPVKSSADGQGKPATILAALQATVVDVPIQSTLLDAVQDVLEQELIPVIQGAVNQGMRDMQLNSRQYFSPAPKVDNQSGQQSSGVRAFEARATGKLFSSKNGAPESKPCLAAVSCLKEAKPLFRYWMQLPQHSEMVVTILDRLVRGFIASAREEIESMTWLLISGQEKFRSTIVAVIRQGQDSWFNAYRRSMFGGKLSASELLASYSRGPSSGAVTEMLSTLQQSFNQPRPTQEKLNQEWEQLWDVGNSKYLVTIDKIVRDFSVLGSIASIGYSCDWLIANLAKACGGALKKLNSASVSISTGLESGRQSFSSEANSLLSGVNKAHRDRLEIMQMQQPLVEGFLGYTKELSKLSEDCWSLLELEAQAACFYFLHQLAHLKILSVSSPQQDSPQSPSYSAGTAQSTVESGIASLLAQHLTKLVDAVISASNSKGALVVLAPLTNIIPQILQRCLSILFLNSNQTAISLSDELLATQHEAKTRLLRLVVVTQQSFGIVIEAAKLDGQIYKVIHEMSNDAFDQVRRYVSLMDLSMNELKNFITASVTGQRKSNSGGVVHLYDKEDLRAIWKFVQKRVANSSIGGNAADIQPFDDFWKGIPARSAIALSAVPFSRTPSSSRAPSPIYPSTTGQLSSLSTTFEPSHATSAPPISKPPLASLSSSSTSTLIPAASQSVKPPLSPPLASTAVEIPASPLSNSSASHSATSSTHSHRPAPVNPFLSGFVSSRKSPIP